MDNEQASVAAMETILHATRAANQGQQEAANALAQLTQSASGLGIQGMTQDQQGSLLLDVLQQVSCTFQTPSITDAVYQLSAASQGKSSRGKGGEANLAEIKETWSTVPIAQPET